MAVYSEGQSYSFSEYFSYPYYQGGVHADEQSIYSTEPEHQVSKADILKSRAKKVGFYALAIIVAVAVLPLAPVLVVGFGGLAIFQILKNKASREDEKIRELVQLRAGQDADRVWMQADAASFVE